MLLNKYHNKNTIINKLIDICETEGWEHITIDDLTTDDIGKKIRIFKKHEINTLCKKTGDIQIKLDKEQYIKSFIKSRLLLNNYNARGQFIKTNIIFVDKYNDLSFIKNQNAPDNDDPLKKWCKEFIKQEKEHKSTYDKLNKAEELLKHFKNL